MRCRWGRSEPGCLRWLERTASEYSRRASSHGEARAAGRARPSLLPCHRPATMSYDTHMGDSLVISSSYLITGSAQVQSLLGPPNYFPVIPCSSKDPNRWDLSNDPALGLGRIPTVVRGPGVAVALGSSSPSGTDSDCLTGPAVLQRSCATTWNYGRFRASGVLQPAPVH